MKNGDFSEFSLIDSIKSGFAELVKGNGVVGIGDDCAIIPQTTGKDTLVSTDLLVEGVHFILDGNGAGISAYELGWKSAAVNISDIAGMGGKPVATFLSIAIPKRIRTMSVRRFNTSETCANSCKENTNVSSKNKNEPVVPWLEEFLRGYKAISSKYGVALLGGDTTGSLDKLCINVSVLGECEHGKAVRRSAAQAGDLICVTGNLGDSAAGLKLLLRNNALNASTETIQCTNLKGNPFYASYYKECLLHKHYMPEPRVKEGIALAKVRGIGAMMDISDGIASDLLHILEESNVLLEQSRRHEAYNGMHHCLLTEESGIPEKSVSQINKLSAVIDVGKLPVSEHLKSVCMKEGWDPVELAVGGGEDYELLFTCRPDAHIPIEHFVIGEIVDTGDVSANGKDTASIVWKGTDRDFSGFNHF